MFSTMERLRKYKVIGEKSLADYRHACQTLKEVRQLLADTREQTKHTETAQTILQESARNVQQQVHTRISHVVTKCLEIFDKPYQFKIEFEKKRGRTEARLSFVRNGYEITPTKSAGIGVVDVASFGLRLACLILSRPARRRIIIADEPFKHVSIKYRWKVRRLLQVLSEEMNVQFILVTHSTRLQVGKIMEIGDVKKRAEKKTRSKNPDSVATEK